MGIHCYYADPYTLQYLCCIFYPSWIEPLLCVLAFLLVCCVPNTSCPREMPEKVLHVNVPRSSLTTHFTVVQFGADSSHI